MVILSVTGGHKPTVVFQYVETGLDNDIRIKDEGGINNGIGIY